jgi:hypothetical protein
MCRLLIRNLSVYGRIRGFSSVKLTDASGQLPFPIAVQTRHKMTPTRALEIRTYRIRSGARNEFGRRMATAVPMLERYGIDVVGICPSEADHEHYALLRSFDSLEERDLREAAFYGSDDWRNGPREGIIELIETYHTVVVRSTQAAIKGLAASLRS